MASLAEALGPIEDEDAEAVPEEDEYTDDMAEAANTAAQDMIDSMQGGDAAGLVEAYKRLRDACE